MFILISLIVGMTLFGQETVKDERVYLSKYELSIGYGYNTPNIATTEYQINSPTHDARHSVHTEQGFDKNTSSKLAIIPEGEVSSIRLGNSNNGSQSEKITYTFHLNSDYKPHTINYKYALVFHTTDSNTEERIQPKFKVKVYQNDLLVEIPLEANPYSKHINFNIENQSKDRIIKWTDWTSDNIDISQFKENDKITIEFESYDCARGRYFGYGYLVIN